MKYVVFIVGLLLVSFGGAVFLIALREVMTGHTSGYSSSDYAAIMGLFGVLPFVCGVALYVFAEKRWLTSKKSKVKHLNTEFDNEKPADSATDATNRRIKKFLSGLHYCL